MSLFYKPILARNKAINKAKKMVGNRITVNIKGMEDVKEPCIFIASYNSDLDKYIIPYVLRDYKIQYVLGLEDMEKTKDSPWKDFGLSVINSKDTLSYYIGQNNDKNEYDKFFNTIFNCYTKSKSILWFLGRKGSIAGTSTLVDPDSLSYYVTSKYRSIVTVTTTGSHLSSPMWADDFIRPVPIVVNITCVFNPKEIDLISLDIVDTSDISKEIRRRIKQEFSYNDYSYQSNNHIKINYPKRAVGLHKALYQCMNCLEKYNMTSYDNILECKSCHSKWSLTENGELTGGDYLSTISISDWYEYQRLECRKYVKEINSTKRGYKQSQTFHVTVKALAKSTHYKYVALGYAKLSVNNQEFTLKFNNSTSISKLYNNVEFSDFKGKFNNNEKRVLKVNSKNYHFPHNSQYTIQVKFSNTVDEGKGIVLATDTCTFFIYSNDKNFEPAELQLLAEEF